MPDFGLRSPVVTGCLYLLFLQQVAYLHEELLFVRRLWSRCRRSCLLLFLRQSVDTLYEEEYTESDDQEIECRLEEIAVVDGGGLHLLHPRDVDGGERDLQVGELDAADEPSDRRHEDVVDDR